MPRHSIGLEIGSTAVRAAEITVQGGSVKLLRFGQVSLPPGAVREGEVLIPDAVGEALRRLWTEGGFKGRQVVVGVSSQRIMVRQADVAAMSEQDLAGALRYQAEEFFPVATEDAVLDFQTLDQVAGPDGTPRSRVLMAAAPPDLVRSHLAALELAGLRAVRADLVPLALVRSLVSPSFDIFGQGPEAIVCVGGGVTNVVVHEDGVPRFVRILAIGGDSITAAIEHELGVDHETAEGMKRLASMGASDPAAARTMTIAVDRMGPLVEEIRGSLDYYLAQGGQPIRRVVVVGGASRLPGLLDRMQQHMGTPVEAGRLLPNLDLTEAGLTTVDLVALGPVLPVSIGLALAEAPIGIPGRRISLLPSEVAADRQSRRRVMMLAGAGALGLVALIAAAGVHAGQISAQHHRLARAQAQQRSLQSQIAGLQKVAKLHTQVLAGTDQVKGALAGDVDWPRVVQEVTRLLPPDVSVTTFSSTADQVSFSSNGANQDSPARWLQAIGNDASVTGPWVQSSSQGQAGVTFASSAHLAQASHTTYRVDQYVGGDK